jgi:hypothetical protein
VEAPAPKPAPAVAVPAGPVADPADMAVVTLTNPLAAHRSAETIALALADLIKLVPGLDLKKTLVVDAHGKPVLSQLVDSDGDETPDQLVFQADFGASEIKTFKLRTGERANAAEADYKAYGRFVRERHDDFAWENDLVAHRVYGPDLETCKKEPLTSSGVDVWVKRVSKLVVNEWYMTDNYHQDHGEGADFYGVGKSRGCGGLGIWSGGKLAVSKNFTGSRVLANGPIRLVFELTYAAWGTGGMRVTETKRVTLDAGSHFNRFESTFKGAKAALPIGIGIAKHPGGAVEVDAKAWPGCGFGNRLMGRKSGNLGTAIVLPPGSNGRGTTDRPRIPGGHARPQERPARLLRGHGLGSRRRDCRRRGLDKGSAASVEPTRQSRAGHPGRRSCRKVSPPRSGHSCVVYWTTTYEVRHSNLVSMRKCDSVTCRSAWKMSML